MFKKIICLAIVIAVVATMFVGCGKEDIEITPTIDYDKLVPIPEVSEKNTEAPEETTRKLSKAEECALQFLTDLQHEDYEAVMSSLYLNESPFVSIEDLRWFIPRSPYVDVPGSTTDISVFCSSGSSVESTVELLTEGAFYDVKVILNDSNEWKVVMEGLTVDNWRIQVPGGVELYVNGVVVGKEYKEGSENLQDIYKIPAVPNKNIKVEIKGTAFGDMGQDVLPSPSNEVIPVWFKLSSEYAETLYAELKLLLNSINEEYENGATAADYSKYISEFADPQVAQLVWGSVHESYTWNSLNDPSNIRYTVVRGGSNVDNVETFKTKLRTGDIVLLNLDIEKTWSNSNGGYDATRVHGTIFVQVIDGKLYIYDIYAENFLSERNSFINDWN